MCIFAKNKLIVMRYKYSKEESETPKVSESAIQYGAVETNKEALMCAPQRPRIISEDEMSRSFTLEEFKQHLDDLVESTHNHATGCVENTPVTPRKCSFKEAQRRSMTINQFANKLHAMVDDFYSTKA